jgi:hypothetical protein
LARKSNTTTTAMDKSSFFFTANCGVCHPGGAAMQYDRAGKPYFDRTAGTYGYNDQATLPASAQLDGDYGFINPATGVPGTANWAKTGVSEADCLMCHMNQYATAPGTANHNNGLSWHKRAGVLRGTGVAGVASFEWAPTAGAGWATLTYVAGQSPPMASAVTVNYDLGLTAGTLVEQGGYLAIPIGKIGGAKDANCRGCHSTPDGKKSGRTLLPTTDAHVAKGVGCTRCHTTPNTGSLDALGLAMANPHQIGKGDITIGSVRNDLDNTVLDCAECHLGGADPLAPDPTSKHVAIPQLHFGFMKCQTCHIRHLDDDPVSPTAEIPDIAYDMTSNGTQNASLWNQYLGTDPLDPANNLPELAGRPFRWYPAVRHYKGKLTTVKPLWTAWYGEWLGGTGDGAVIRPLPLRLVRKALTNAYAPGSARLASLPLTPGTKVTAVAPILHRKDEIRASLVAMRDATDTANPDATANDIVLRPVLVRADKVYFLNASDEVEYFESLVAESHDFAVNHNVVTKRDPLNPVVSPGPYGAGGCNDCHGPRSAFFYGKQLAEPAQYDYLDEHGTIPNPEAGQPEYVSQYELMGYGETRVGLLTGTLAAVNLQVYGLGSVTVTDGTRTQTCTNGGCIFGATPGSTVTFTATASGGGSFAGFMGCAVGADPSSCQVVAGTPTSGLANPPVAVRADFLAPPPPPNPTAFALVVSVKGQGNVSGGGIDCRSNAGTCKLDGVPTGTEVTLTATGGVNGYTFGGWAGCSSVTGGQCTVSVTTNTLVTATYNPPPPPPSPTSYALVTSVSGGRGTVSGTDNAIACASNTGTCSVSVAAGSSATLSAAPGTGYTFVGWSGCSSAIGDLCTVVVNANTLVVAKFSTTP